MVASSYLLPLLTSSISSASNRIRVKMSSKTAPSEDHTEERLVRKLNYHLSTIEKLISSVHANSKIVVIKEKIEQLEELVLDIPDCCPDLFDEWMERVVLMWEQYSGAASAAGHRPANSAAYPKPSDHNSCSTSANITSTATSTYDVVSSCAATISHRTVQPEKRSALKPRTGAANQQHHKSHRSSRDKSYHHSAKLSNTAKYNRIETSCSGDDHP